MTEKPESEREDVEVQTEIQFDYFDPEGMFRAGGDYSYTRYNPRELDNPDSTE